MSLTVEKCLQGWTNSLRQMNARADVVFFGDTLIYNGDFASALPGMVVCNLGLRGDTLQGMMDRVEQVKLLKPKTVYLMAGINDVAGTSVDEFREQYGLLILLLGEQIPMMELIVFNMLPVNDVDFSISCNNKQIVRGNQIIASLCSKHGLRCVDLYAIYEHNGKLPKEMTRDGIHLFPKEYSRWYEVINSLFKI